MVSPLDALIATLGPPAVWSGRPLCAAYSGGLDSSVLLDCLCQLRAEYGYLLLAAHVHHGLQGEADAWAAHCAEQAAALQVAFRLLHVQVPLSAGDGVEAAARRARYAALAQVGCSVLLTAHHRDDQAETVLLQLLRGAGPAGLAAMGSGVQPAAHPWPGTLLRPFLGLDRSVLLSWARQRGLHWREDPSNHSPQFDRSFVRHSIGPILEERFPAWRAGLARSAQWAAEAQSLLDALAEQDIAHFATEARPGEASRDPSCLPGHVVDYLGLPEPRRRNILRHLLSVRGVPPPPPARLAEWIRQWNAAAGRQPAVSWGDWVLRCWSGRLWIERLPTAASTRLEPDARWAGCGAFELNWSGGRLTFADTWPVERGEQGASLRRDCGPLDLAHPAGTARLRPHARGPSRPLRKLYQEVGLPPWRRARLPGLYSEGRLIAVPGVAVDAGWQAEPGDPGWRILWQDGGILPGRFSHGQKQFGMV